jgi:hypothetical protein
MDNNAVVVLLVFGVIALMIFLVVQSLRKYRRLRQDLQTRGVRISARVLGRSTTRLSNSNSLVYSVSVAYEVSGKTYKKALGIDPGTCAALEGRETVEIVYLPEKPKTALLASQV